MGGAAGSGVLDEDTMTSSISRSVSSRNGLILIRVSLMAQSMSGVGASVPVSALLVDTSSKRSELDQIGLSLNRPGSFQSQQLNKNKSHAH